AESRCSAQQREDQEHQPDGQHHEDAAEREHEGEDEVRLHRRARHRLGGRRCERGLWIIHRQGASGRASSTASPYSASFFAPTPLTVPSCCMDVGAVSTIPTRVASENTMYGGICFSFATEVRQARSASKRSR